jgi:hypothetical protein
MAGADRRQLVSCDISNELGLRFGLSAGGRTGANCRQKKGKRDRP